MKLIVLAVLSMAVFRASCRERPIDRDLDNGDFYPTIPTDLPYETDSPVSWNQYYGGNIHNGPEGEASTSDEDIIASTVDMDPGYYLDNFLNHDSSVNDHRMKEVETAQNENVLRGGSKCKSEVVCSLLGGDCILNTTSCSGREIPNACGGGNCKCCFTVPFTENMEEIMYDLEAEFKAMAANFTITNSNLNTKLQSILNSNLDSKFNSILSNLTDVINNMKDDLDSKLDTIMEERGCPEGTFNVSSSNQCFKFLGDKHRTFEDGKAACKALGMQLAQPNDPVALQKYLVPSQEHHQWSWLGARGDGSNFKWESNGEIISASNPLWWPGHPGNYVSSTYCLVLFTNQGMMNSQPNKPIGANTCTKVENTICEYVRN